MENTIVNFEFEGCSISFEKGDGVMVNATEMAKPFSKSVKHWSENINTTEFVFALAEERGITPNPDFVNLLKDSEVGKTASLNISDLAKLFPSLIHVVRGGIKDQGTWLHEDIALEFARWLSPKFAIWCNDRIKELLTTGVATVSDDDAIIANAISILQKRLEESKARQKALEKKVAEDKPKVEYHDQVLTSVSTLTTTQIAKELGMSAIALNKKLHELKVQYKQNGSWVPYAKYQGKGYTESETIKIEGKDGTVATKMVFKWTEMGRKFIHELLNKNK